MSYIPIFVEYNRKPPSELRICEDILIQSLKERLYIATGCPPHNMNVQLVKQNASAISLNNDDSTPLSNYQVQKYDTIRITLKDPSLSTGNYNHDNFEHVPKFEISQEQYLKRPDNASAWMAQNFPGNRSSSSLYETDTDTKFPALAIGDRIFVAKGNNLTSDLRKYPLATVFYTGDVHFQEPSLGDGLHWIGIAYDNPIGKHDGTVDGIRYFTSPSKHGAFVRRKACISIFTGNEEIQ